jgi:uncharacterized membrane protein
MILILHIVIALTSLTVTAAAYVKPSAQKLRLSGILVAATLASGTYLVVSTHSPLASACVSGLAYLAIVAAGLRLAYGRLKHSVSD